MKENYTFYLLSLFLSFICSFSRSSLVSVVRWYRFGRSSHSHDLKQSLKAAAQVFYSHSRHMSLRVQTVFIGPNDVNSSWQSLSAFKEMLRPINQGKRKVSRLTELHVIRAYRGCASKVRRTLPSARWTMKSGWERRKVEVGVMRDRNRLLLWRFRANDRSSFRYRYIRDRIKRWEVRKIQG